MPDEVQPSNALVKPSASKSFGSVIGKVVVILLGIAVGWVVAVIIGLITGLIQISC